MACRIQEEHYWDVHAADSFANFFKSINLFYVILILFLCFLNNITQEV
jgi:hypothetical protein